MLPNRQAFKLLHKMDEDEKGGSIRFRSWSRNTAISAHAQRKTAKTKILCLDW